MMRTGYGAAWEVNREQESVVSQKLKGERVLRRITLMVKEIKSYI